VQRQRHDEFGITAYALAKALRVPANRITGIVNGQRAITADTALRLARFFGTTPATAAQACALGKFGARFSRTAATPSAASSLRKHSISMASDASKIGPACRIQLFSDFLV